MDEIDLKILELLQKNARISHSALARSVHLSVTAVGSRVRRLEDDGVILGYQARINGEKAGKAVHGFIIAGAWQTRLDTLYHYLDSVPEIVRVETIISGGKELLLEFYCTDLDALMAFYKGGIRDYLETMTVYLVKDPPAKAAGVPLE